MPQNIYNYECLASDKDSIKNLIWTHPLCPTLIITPTILNNNNSNIDKNGTDRHSSKHLQSTQQSLHWLQYKPSHSNGMIQNSLKRCQGTPQQEHNSVEMTLIYIYLLTDSITNEKLEKIGASGENPRWHTPAIPHTKALNIKPHLRL